MVSRRKVDGTSTGASRSLENSPAREMSEALFGMMSSCLGVQESLRTLCLGLQEANRELNELRQAIHLSRQEMNGQVRELQERWDNLQQKLGDASGKVELLLIGPQDTSELSPLPGSLEPAEISAPIAVEETDAFISANAGDAMPARRAALGVTVDPDAKVVDVLPGTPAEKAGLQPGDLVLGVDGTPVSSSEQLRTVIREAEAGKEVLLTVCRGEQTEEVTARLAQPDGATILEGEHVQSLAHP